MEQPDSHPAGQGARSPGLLGPLSFMNPTSRYVKIEKESSSGSSAADKPEEASRLETTADGAPYHVWRSRDNRKGRHALVVTPEYYKQNFLKTLRPTNTLRESLGGIARMAVRFPVWDVSYDVAMAFTLGMGPTQALYTAERRG